MSKPADKLTRLEYSPLVRLEAAPMGLCQVDDDVLVLKYERLGGWEIAPFKGEHGKLYAHTQVYPVRLVEVGLHVEGEVE